MISQGNRVERAVAREKRRLENCEKGAGSAGGRRIRGRGDAAGLSRVQRGPPSLRMAWAPDWSEPARSLSDLTDMLEL